MSKIGTHNVPSDFPNWNLSKNLWFAWNQSESCSIAPKFESISAYVEWIWRECQACCRKFLLFIFSSLANQEKNSSWRTRTEFSFFLCLCASWWVRCKSDVGSEENFGARAIREDQSAESQYFDDVKFINFSTWRSSLLHAPNEQNSDNRLFLAFSLELASLSCYAFLQARVCNSPLYSRVGAACIIRFSALIHLRRIIPSAANISIWDRNFDEFRWSATVHNISFSELVLLSYFELVKLATPLA